MADKQLNGLTAASALSTADLFLVEQSGNSRKATGAQVLTLALAGGGAKVRNSAALTGQNLTSTTAITFNAEDWDDAAYHDTSSNTDRLTVPAAGRYGLRSALRLENVDAANRTINVQLLRYNSGGVAQETLGRMQIASLAGINYLTVTGSGLFASGDFARMEVSCSVDTSVDIATQTYFEIYRMT